MPNLKANLKSHPQITNHLAQSSSQIKS